MRFVISAFLAGTLVTSAANAADNQIQNGPVPKWVTISDTMAVPASPTGGVFIRRQDVEIHTDDKGQLLYTGYRIKILHPNALQLGNLSLVWNPATGAPVVHVIKIYRDAEEIDVLKSTHFEILRREDQLEQARLDGNLTAVLRVPDLRVGDELEFGATTRSSDPTLGKDDAGLLYMNAEPPSGRYHLGLSWEIGNKPTIRATSDMAAVAKNGENKIDYQFDNPLSQSPPKDAPPRYQWQRIIEFSRFSDWQGISRRFAALFAAASALDPASPLKQEAAKISAAQPSQLGRAAAALKIVQQDIRYIYVGLNGGNFTPASADDTWLRRYGDCKAKTALLLALLHEMNIEAEAVLANNDGGDGLDARLPSPRMFDHVLVRLRIDGKTYWLDGTLPSVVPPADKPTIPYQWVLPLTEKGSDLEGLNWRPATRPDEINLFEIDAREGFDKPAHIVSTTIKRGIEGLQQEAEFAAATPAQLLNAFRQNAIGDTWQSIDDVQWRYDVKAQASILTIIGSGTVAWENEGSGGKGFALPGGGFSPPEKRLRAAEQDQTVPFYNKPRFDCFVTTVRLPLTTKEQQWSHKDAINNQMFGRSYYRAFDIRDGALRMIRGSRIEQKEVDAATAKHDNARIPLFDNSMGWITFNPKAVNRASAARVRVPTTYELDWSADNVPCLSVRTAE